MAVGLSDGSTLKVTTNHPFFVDASAVRAGAGWMQAGDLRLGDRLRTASGVDVTITALRYHQGTAHVYTLTVAHDHTFFVGDGIPVLVHNAGPCPIIPGLRPAEQASLTRLAQLPEFADRTFSAAPTSRVDWIDDLGRTYDQLGNPVASQHWAYQESNFLQQISDHVAKADFAVIDMTGFTQSQIDTVRQYVDALPQADQDKIVRLGF